MSAIICGNGGLTVDEKEMCTRCEFSNSFLLFTYLGPGNSLSPAEIAGVSIGVLLLALVSAGFGISRYYFGRQKSLKDQGLLTG